MTASGWRPVCVSAAVPVSAGPRHAESGLCQQPSCQPARPLSAAVDSERVYQYAWRTVCMEVRWLVAQGRGGGAGWLFYWWGRGIFVCVGRDTGSPGPLRFNGRCWVEVTQLLLLRLLLQKGQGYTEKDTLLPLGFSRSLMHTDTCMQTGVQSNSPSKPPRFTCAYCRKTF